MLHLGVKWCRSFGLTSELIGAYKSFIRGKIARGGEVTMQTLLLVRPLETFCCLTKLYQFSIMFGCYGYWNFNSLRFS